MARNRVPSRKKHLNVKYFFMHDFIKRGDMSVEYCPTGDMLADVLTKPLQGPAFQKMRSKLMNTPEIYVEDATLITPSSVPESTGVQTCSKTGATESKLTGVRWGKQTSTTRMYNIERTSRNRKT